MHHGGAGTTQAALLAGKPSIIVAHGFDQLYWGKQLERQYLGGKPLLRESVNSSTLVTEIENVLNSVLIKDKAITTGRKMQQENGVQNAIFEIEKAMSK